jgi:hypothetical protein
MNCARCGTQNPEGSSFCSSCGSVLNQTSSEPVRTPINAQESAPPQVQQTSVTKKTSGLAIASLVTGILGISLLAVIFGWISLVQMGRDPNLTGKGLAIAGLVLGIIGFAAGIIMIIVFIGVATLGF